MTRIEDTVRRLAQLRGVVAALTPHHTRTLPPHPARSSHPRNVGAWADRPAVRTVTASPDRTI